MRSITTLQMANDTLLSLQLSTLTQIGSDLLSQQVLSAMNRAQQRMFELGSWYWLEFMGTFITSPGKRTYDVTPSGSNYCPTSRDFSGATLNNVTLVPKYAVSWDDTYNLSQFTATGANPSVTITSVGSIKSTRVAASIWLSMDGTNTASTGTTTGDVTLTLTDGVGLQSVHTTVTVGTTPNRFNITGYFDGSSTTVKLKVSWTNPAGIVYLDSCQIEPTDWTTEYIDNTTTSPVARTIFAEPSRIIGVGNYQAGTTPTYQDIYLYDMNLYQHEHDSQPDLLGNPFFSTRGGSINTRNAPDYQHVIYRAKSVPPNLTGVSGEVIPIPDPWRWVMVEGTRAYMLQSQYDIGANMDAASAIKTFENKVDEALQMADPYPNWIYAHNNTVRMLV